MRHATLVAAPLLVGTLAGCGWGPVPVDVHTPLAGTEDVCAELLAAVPEVVSDAVRREVDPSSPGVTAWGRPPIVLRCGVPPPTGVDPTFAVLEVDGVGWYSVVGEGGTFFTTADRGVLVEVAIPDDYAPEGAVLADLAGPIRATVPPEQG
jgi:hypothetical protein